MRGRKEADLNLLKGDAWFKKLCQDYKLPSIDFNADEYIHVIRDADGNPLEDIRTPQDNDAAADEITSWIRKLTQSKDSELHVSIAGGRKTLGFFAGYALSLFGRDQDRLSHVLVSSPYENHKLFFYPTPYERIIHTETTPSITLNCQSAEVWLADIPFVRLSSATPRLPGHCKPRGSSNSNSFSYQQSASLQTKTAGQPWGSSALQQHVWTLRSTREITGSRIFWL